MIRLNIMKEKHFGKNVYTNLMTDIIRKTQCLCLNCNIMNKCKIAKSLYKICIDNHCALMITRCKNWKANEEKP